MYCVCVCVNGTASEEESQEEEALTLLLLLFILKKRKWDHEAPSQLLTVARTRVWSGLLFLLRTGRDSLGYLDNSNANG